MLTPALTVYDLLPVLLRVPEKICLSSYGLIKCHSTSGIMSATEYAPWLYAAAALGLLTLHWVAGCLRIAYRSDLSSLPGPKFAPYSGLYRVFRLWSGQAPAVYLKLHEEYGPIVRTGPNTVSIADPTTVPTIYGISSAFLKVRIST